MTDANESVPGLGDLLAAVARGDRGAFELLYRRTSAKLFGICVRMLPQRSDAEDLLQEVYLTVWHKAAQFDAQRASPITWLAMIARNKCIDRLRVGGVERHQETIDGLDLPDEAQPGDPVEWHSEQRRLDQCLSGLEVRHQQVIRTAFFDGCTYEELASRTGVPLGTMKSWIRRSLIRLKACLER